MRRLALVAASLLTLGVTCEGETPVALLRFEPREITVAPGTLVTLDLVMDTSGPALQAFEVGIDVDPAVLTPVDVLPHTEFDDDGQLFISPTVDAGSGEIRGVVELRHGAGATGSVRVASFQFMAGAAGWSEVAVVTSGLAAETGQVFITGHLKGYVTVSP